MAHPSPKHESTVHRLPSFVRTRVTAAPGGKPWTLERGSFLTPYAAEEIGQEARRAGRGAQLEVIVPPVTSNAGLAAVEELFGWLREKGLAVVIRRGGPED